MSIARLGYIGISASDLDAWDRVAMQVLGAMAAEPAGADERRYRLDDQAWRIAVQSGDADDLAYAGFETIDKNAFDRVCKRVADHDIDVEIGDAALCAQRGVMALAHCVDPDGLRIEIYYGPGVLTDKPFHSPAAVSGFVTGDQGMGHIFLQSADIPRLRHFYRDVLGFGLSDIINMPLDPSKPDEPVDLEFYHCNPRHHSVGMAPGEGKHMHHFMLEARTLDDVGYALDRAEAAGVPVPVALGRHSNDLVVSFYIVAPSGFAIEFGHGGVEVGEGWRTVRHTSPSAWGHKGLGGR